MKKQHTRKYDAEPRVERGIVCHLLAVALVCVEWLLMLAAIFGGHTGSQWRVF